MIRKNPQVLLTGGLSVADASQAAAIREIVMKRPAEEPSNDPSMPLRVTTFVSSLSSLVGGQLCAPARSNATARPTVRIYDFWDRASSAKPSAVAQTQPAGDARTLSGRNAELHLLICRALEEEFEDGMVSDFSVSLQSFLQRHGESGIQVLREWIGSKRINPGILAEALEILGRFKHETTRAARFAILIAALTHGSPMVRDAAGLGLASMRDPRAIPHVLDAIGRESNPELRADLELVVRDLRM